MLINADSISKKLLKSVPFSHCNGVGKTTIDNVSFELNISHIRQI